MANSIEIKELNTLISIDHTITLLDVRRKTEYEAAPQKITGATWRDPEKMDAWVTQLPGSQSHRCLLRQGWIGQPVRD